MVHMCAQYGGGLFCKSSTISFLVKNQGSRKREQEVCQKVSRQLYSPGFEHDQGIVRPWIYGSGRAVSEGLQPDISQSCGKDIPLSNYTIS